MTNVSNMMTGKLPGITSIQRSGQPGADQTSIFVRGVSTFNNSSPLCLVDGIERMINTVNPNDIASITILSRMPPPRQSTVCAAPTVSS